MDEGRRSSKRKIIILLAAVAVALGVIIIISVLFLTSRDNSYRVTALISLPGLTEKPSDFKNSYINIYENGTFDVEIIYHDTKHFVGIGTYEKKDKSYVFLYLDVYTPVGGELVQNLGLINTTHEYEIVDKSKIRFELQGKFYIFSR